MATSALIRIDTQDSLRAVLADLAGVPPGIRRARDRARRKLRTWLKRQVLRTVAQVAGSTQKTIAAMLRYSAKKTESGGLDIWIGTNPMAVQYLGRVVWKRRMAGARVGRQTYPGTWSWGEGSKTGKAVMRRTGHRYAVSTAAGGALRGSLAKSLAGPGASQREGIEEVKVEMHERVKAAIEAMQPEITRRFEALLTQELNYALNVEKRAA